MVKAFLGLLVLDTRFPRLAGDAGRPDSYPMPVRARTVQGASPRRVVHEADVTLLQPFIEAARALVDEGAAAITTSCGFLYRWQAALQGALPVPVWSSSLLKLPELARPGVLTVDAPALAPLLPGVPTQGLVPGCHLQRVLLDDLPALDAATARADAVAAARALVERHPELTDLVLECTNLPPHAEAIHQATGLPVHHLISLANERWNAP